MGGCKTIITKKVHLGPYSFCVCFVLGLLFWGNFQVVLRLLAVQNGEVPELHDTRDYLKYLVIAWSPEDCIQFCSRILEIKLGVATYKACALAFHRNRAGRVSLNLFKCNWSLYFY